jgi:hypothetical protein
LDQIRSKFEELGLDCSNEDALAFLRKDELLKDVARLLDKGHTRAEIDKTAKQILSDRLTVKEGLN